MVRERIKGEEDCRRAMRRVSPLAPRVATRQTPSGIHIVPPAITSIALHHIHCALMQFRLSSAFQQFNSYIVAKRSAEV